MNAGLGHCVEVICVIAVGTRAATIPPFTYAILPNAFPFISVAPTTGAVTISTASVAGSYSITI